MSDYTNRVYDYLALQNISASSARQLGLALFTEKNSGQICTGVQKLAQRWLLEFMTEVGSMPGLPTRGTDFMAATRNGSLRTAASITTEFNFAAYTASVNLQNEENDTWPDDERISSAELDNLEFAPGSAKLYVSIYSRAGNSRQVILPVSILPIN